MAVHNSQGTTKQARGPVTVACLKGRVSRRHIASAFVHMDLHSNRRNFVVAGRTVRPHQLTAFFVNVLWQSSKVPSRRVRIRGAEALIQDFTSK